MHRQSHVALAEFYLAGIGCLAISLLPQLGGWPLLPAALFWSGRLFWLRLPFRKTYLDIPLLLFVLTGLVGVWAAYNPEAAQHKFYLILGAVLFFYALANQPEGNRWIVILSLGAFGVVTTLAFLVITDWSHYTADLAALERLGRQLSAIQPQTARASGRMLATFHPNLAGGIIAMLLPFGAAAAIHSRQQHHQWRGAVSVIMLAIPGFGLLLSSSRAAWGSVLLGMGAFAALTFPKTNRLMRRWHLFLLLPAILVVAGLLLPPLLAGYFSTPGSPIADVGSFDSRIRIARDTVYLITDFPFTGGGLGSFPGLYSQYMLVIPSFLFSYSHNLYLDLALEQGILGLALWVGIVLLTAATLKPAGMLPDQESGTSLIRRAIYASLVILLPHGIADDPVYAGSWGLVLLFALPGLAANLAPEDHLVGIESRASWRGGVILAMLVLGLGVLFAHPLQAAWQANRGAVQMARLQLANWPTGDWETPEEVQKYAQTAVEFKRALEINVANRTANHRLGLILMGQQHFQDAVTPLERAYAIAPGHPGVKKSLGYCYTWLGEFDRAESLLREFPEARSEMKTYVWWWHIQGRDDLADNAAIMTARLASPSRTQNRK